MGDELKPPKTLKKMGKQLWEDVINGWELQPEQLVILEDLCRCQDRLSELDRILREEGQMLRDRYGHAKMHPGSAALKGEIGNFSLALEAPSSDVRPGRPDGWQPED